MTDPTTTGTRADQAPVTWVDPGEPGFPPPEWPPPEPPGADEPKPPRRRFRWAPRSLTARLVTGVVSLVVVLVLATGIGTFFALRSFLLTRLDQQLNATVSENSLSRLLNPSPGTLQIVEVPQKVWVLVLAKSGAPTSVQPQGPELEDLSLNGGTRTHLVNGTTKPVSVRTTTGEHIRLVAITGLSLRTVNPATGVESRQPVTVLVGLSQGEVDRTMHRLVLLEWVIGSAAILLAFGATTYGVRYSLRRLHGVTRTAQQVAAELSPQGTGLDRRVDVDEPDTEVGQLAESMNTLLAAVETQFAARIANEERMRQFLADASHELRTPLTSIRGYAELARMQKQQGEQAEDNLARIESEGTRMSRLVDDLLTLARSDQGSQPQHEVVDFGDLVEDAVSDVRAVHPSRQIELIATADLLIVGDRDQLLRIVLNLVTNAAVHTRPDGPIRVTVAAEGADAVLRVVDSGPGLEPEDAAHVFERFWRADKARTRSRGGSGLGMAIVASIAWAHGGSVDFQSTVARGSTVTVRIPRRPPGGAES